MSRRGCAGARRPRILIIVLTVVFLVASLTSIACGSQSEASTTSAPATSTSAGENGIAGSALQNANASPATRVAEVLGPSIVNVLVASAQGQPLGLGTGVIYKADGMIVTNNHVVTAGSSQPAAQITVTLATGEQLPATIVGRDPVSDLAVIKIDRTGLPAAQFVSDLSNVRVGDYAVAIGTPLGLEGTVTMGIVSAIKREIQVTSTAPPADYIQTDAAISPGNSGGALADAEGNVIGINAAGLQPASGAQNIGFAIPSDVVIFVADQLISRGQVRYSFLGVQTAEITPALRQQFGLGSTEGVAIVAVSPGSPAANAGLRQGDIIVSLAGKSITNTADLFSALRETAPGQQVDVQIVRGGQEQTVKVTLGQRPGQ